MVEKIWKFVVGVWILMGGGFIAFAQSNAVIKGLPFISNYEASDYQAGIQNWDIAQDDLGRIYVANNLGLLEFDGKSWHRYGLNFTKVRSISWSNSGKIYVGSQADFGYLVSDERGRLSYTSLADSLPVTLRDFDETWKVFEIDGIVFFCTFRRIYRYDGENLTPVESDQRLDISFQINNQLLTLIPGRGLFELKNSELKIIRNGEFFADKRVSNVLPFEQGKWLITTFNDGIFIYDGEVKPFQMQGDFWKDEYIINHSLRLKNGNVALGTQNAGLFVIDPNGNLILQLDKSSGLLDLTINYSYEDQNGSLWLAMNNGISRVDLNSPFSIIDDRLGLAGSGYAAFKQRDAIFLGTNNGLFALENDRLSFVEGTEGQVYSIQEIQDQLVIGHHNGTFLIKNKQAQKILDEPGAWLIKPFPDRVGWFIQGTYTGLNLFRMNQGKLEFVRKLEGFDESSRVMEFEGNTLWVAHGYKGVFKVTFDEELTRVKDSKLYNHAQGFPNDVLINVYKVANRLIFTANGGFYSYQASTDRFEPLDEYNDLFKYGTVIADLESDGVGNIYFIEQSQLGLIRRTPTNQMELHTAPFHKVRRLWNDDLANITVLDQQNIVIGAKVGFIQYRPQQDVPSTVQPKIFFRQIISSGIKSDTLFLGYSKMPPAEHENEFPYKQNSLSFDFVSPHFESGAEIQYQFKLENYDNEWSPWSEESKKEYTNLREGDYVFQVRAKTLFGQETEVISYQFSIRPPIYRSFAAYLFYALGSGFLLFLGFKWLDKRHQIQTQQLVQEKKRALQRKDDEIETITQRSEEEIMKLKNSQLQSEIEFKNQELTSSAMHLIQKNKLLHDIKNSLRNLTEEEKNKQLTTQLNRLIKSIDKDLEGTEEWSRFAENFDQVHGNFITRLKEKYPDLTAQEIKFSAYIRMNLNTKEIANLLGISVRGVEIGRYRVRKKLALSRQENLSDFLLRF